MGSLSVWHWIVVVFLLAAIAPLVFYILSFRTTAAAVNAAGGNAPVNAAWLLLIPLFGVVWYFVLLIQLRAAMRSTNFGEPDNQWWIFGMAAGCLTLFSIVLPSVTVGLVQIVILVAQITLAVLHWFKLVQIRAHFSR